MVDVTFGPGEEVTVSEAGGFEVERTQNFSPYRVGTYTRNPGYSWSVYCSPCGEKKRREIRVARLKQMADELTMGCRGSKDFRKKVGKRWGDVDRLPIEVKEHLDRIVERFEKVERGSPR
jgi:hypothetical protein